MIVFVFGGELLVSFMGVFWLGGEFRCLSQACLL